MLILLVLRRLKIKNTYLAGVLLQEFKMKKINCIKQQIEDNIYLNPQSSLQKTIG